MFKTIGEIVKRNYDLTTEQVPCYFEALEGPRIRGAKGSSVFIKIMIPLVKSLLIISLNPGTPACRQAGLTP
jgi:hypothetical protein